MFAIFRNTKAPIEKPQVSMSAQNSKRVRRLDGAMRSSVRNQAKTLMSFDEVIANSKERVVEVPDILTATLRKGIVILESSVQSRVILAFKADTAPATLKTQKSRLHNLNYIDVLDARLGEDCWDKLSERLRSDLRETHGSIKTKNEALKNWSTIVDYGINRGASDIHIIGDPRGDDTSIRYRIDGVLQEHERYSQLGYDRIVEAVRAAWNSTQNKNTSKENGYVTNHIRDTIISHSAQGKLYDLRFQQSPHGDQSGSDNDTGFNLVMRITASGSSATLIDLNDYGYASFTYELIGRRIRKFNGLTLIAGPTGSGKSTACLASVKSAAIQYSGKKLQTIEDPIESIIGHNVAQMSVPSTEDSNGSTGYVKAMKAVLRQDPDLIYCGEVQGSEMARLTMSAAITGHMTLATLHSENALLIPDNFASKGVEFESLIGPGGLMLAIAQKLVGRACPACSKPLLRENNKLLFDAVSRVIPTDLIENVRVHGQNQECNVCEGRGVKGRIPVEEALPITDAIRSAFLSRDMSKVTKAWYDFDILVALGDGYHGRTIEDRALFLASQGVILANDLYLLIENFEQCRPSNPEYKKLEGQAAFAYIWGRTPTTKKKYVPGFVHSVSQVEGV
ncbi:GspE/PulE family protein [Reinekea sp. G2M2-21]|uniref:GspE/PulE family protein n=1 Tax=Reinekea sp. G2M2-21 TaxID=2788942 RepID=UPI0018AAA835|nr:ATPase, T2SS/T4P/T4SS family [Reinekea sp. G2M2-21]